MAFAGFAVMSPLTVAAMLDSNRWRSIVYADTPRCKSRYDAFVKEAKKDDRHNALVVVGATNLHRVQKDAERFQSVLVFDTVQNLCKLEDAVPSFSVVDIEKKGDADLPRHLTPTELAEVVQRPGSVPAPTPLAVKLVATLGQRKPSVLEATSRMPSPSKIPPSGMRDLLSDVKDLLTADSPSFQEVLNTYVKYVFRLVPRNTVTQEITKKLPEAAKPLWQNALDFATSKVGTQIAVAFRSLCIASDPGYRLSHAVSKYGLKAYAGDMVYFTAIIPPAQSFVFPSDLEEIEQSFTTKGKQLFKAGKASDAKRRQKMA